MGTSIIRTIVPIIVGAIASGLATIGFQLSDEGQELIGTLLGAIIAVVYYVIVRVLEQRFPNAGVLLGKPSRPVYFDKTPFDTDADEELEPDDAEDVPLDEDSEYDEELVDAEIDETPVPDGYRPRH